MNGTEPLKVKHHSLTGRITLKMMYDAFKSVRKNRGAAGVDRQSLEMFEANLEQNLAALMKDLKQGTFQPKPALRKHIDKGDGKTRPLGIPTVRDRVAQEVLRQLLTPLFEPLFHNQSYARYYATSFSTVGQQFRYLDSWLRSRLRCMKHKRISRMDNTRFLNKHIRRHGVIALSDFLQNVRGLPCPSI